MQHFCGGVSKGLVLLCCGAGLLVLTYSFDSSDVASREDDPVVMGPMPREARENDALLRSSSAVFGTATSDTSWGDLALCDHVL